MGAFHLRVRDKWMQQAPGGWWGDSFDVRFELIQRLRGLRDRRILEVGCGHGVLLSELDGASNWLCGFDLLPDPLRVARRLTPPGRFLVADWYRCPFPAETFDVVTTTQIIMNAQTALFVQELHRLLRPQGVLFLTTPNRAYPRYRGTDWFPTYETLREALQPYFDCAIWGYNHLSRFRLFDRLSYRLAGAPGVDLLLRALMRVPALRQWGRFFFVAGRKRT